MADASDPADIERAVATVVAEHGRIDALVCNRTWIAELAPSGIRVNVLSPGSTETPMLADVSDEIRATILSRVPLGRLARPEEIAAAALFLASDESSPATWPAPTCMSTLAWRKSDRNCRRLLFV